MNKEFKRMQELAGLTEIKVTLKNQFPGKRHPLIDYEAWDIDPEDLDDYGEYDEETNTFEVESGSDAMADVFDTIYIGDNNWYDDLEDDEELGEALSEFYDFLLTKAAKKAYGKDVNIESY